MELFCSPEFKHHQQKILLFLKKFKPYKVKEFLKKTNNNSELFYMKLNELFKAQTLEKKKSIFEECKTLCKNSDLFSRYKKYLENLEHVFKFKKSCIDENIIHYSELEPYKLTVNDCFLNGSKNNKYNWLETQNNKFLDYSNKKLNIIRFRGYLEKNIPEVIDTILEKTPLKKLGLTPLNMGEIYYDYKFYNKATEYLIQVKESGNNNYVVTMLKNMGKNKEALDVIFSDKDNDNLPLLVNDILKVEPNLKGYVDELCSKNKISLQ
jgi:tetratricopeptide (TPR) repeat protein